MRNTADSGSIYVLYCRTNCSYSEPPPVQNSACKQTFLSLFWRAFLDVFRMSLAKSFSVALHPTSCFAYLDRYRYDSSIGSSLREQASLSFRQQLDRLMHDHNRLVVLQGFHQFLTTEPRFGCKQNKHCGLETVGHLTRFVGETEQRLQTKPKLALLRKTSQLTVNVDSQEVLASMSCNKS